MPQLNIIMLAEIYFIVPGEAGTVMESPVGAGLPAIADAAVVGQYAEIFSGFFDDLHHAMPAADITVAWNADVGFAADDIFSCFKLVFSTFSCMDELWEAAFLLSWPLRDDGLVILRNGFAQSLRDSKHKHLLAARAFDHGLLFIPRDFFFRNGNDLLTF